VDVQELDEGDSVHLSDLVLPEGVAIVALSYGDEDRDIPVASVTVPRGPTPEELDEAEASEAAAEGDADTDADADADSDASDDAGGDDDTD
jgi:large subunit ribosomal protein L25